MAEQILQIEELNSGILKNISFTWKQGETLAIMGANGSGKSTLARALTGLDRSEGQIHLYYEGGWQDFSRLPRWQVIGLVRQHPRRQCIGASIGEELSFGLLNLGYHTNEIIAKTEELLSFLGLVGKENQSPATLSGGERQRLAVGAVLAMAPPFLILDEAFTMLDYRAQDSLLRMLKEKHAMAGQLWITHDPEMALKADRLFLMQEGKMTEVKKDTLLDQSLCSQYGIRSLLSVYGQDHNQSAKEKENIPRSGEEFRREADVLVWNKAGYGERGERLKINQRVKEREFIGIVGPSGAGKSTLLESAVGLVHPEEGEVWLLGSLIGKQGKSIKSLGELRKKGRLVLQEAGEFLVGRNIYEVVFGRSRKKWRPGEQQEHLAYLQGFGIDERLSDAAPELLSGGERQMAALALALADGPKLLLLDEPMLGLDAAGRRRVQEIIEGNLGRRTILYVTHDLREILPYADRIWGVYQGRIMLDCPKKEWGKHREELEVLGVKTEWGGKDRICLENYK